MSDTAETDAESEQDAASSKRWARGVLWRGYDVVHSDFARKLERERDEARKELAELRKNSLALVEELKKSVIRLAKERDEARGERDEAMQMLGEQLYQRVNEWTEEVERLLGELNAAREEVIELKAEREAYSMNRRNHDPR